MGESDALPGPVVGAQRTEFAGIAIDVARAGDARVKRIVYPPGLRWSVDVQPLVGGDLCEHAHVGFLVQGRLQGEYADGCAFDFVAPQVVSVDAGHDAWVSDDEPTVLVEVDFEQDTTARLGLPARHAH
jgi:hypothetical protein